MNRLIGIIILSFCLLPRNANGQKDTVSTGGVQGIAFDSVHNYVLGNATVAIYKSDTAILVDYQLANKYGEFQFERIPAGIPLKIVLSYVGYADITIPFTLSKAERIKNFGKVFLTQKENMLEEVKVIYIPPVRMNKDTLEFNADAFTTDENAVVEDLLRKLPGVTIWGDGSITVNGREVKSLLVNGKPFLGGSSKVAIQNIPKDAVEKVQVYQQGQNPSATRDSTTEVNIKLKADRDIGYFGKLAAGQGNTNRYEQQAGLNWFSPKTQFGAIASRNNTNRIAGNALTLLENSTFKGGSDRDYQPQFNLPGVNKLIEGGIIFQRDFIEKPDFYNKNRLDANYFLSHTKKLVDRNSKTITALNRDENITTNSAYANNGVFNNHRFDAKYDKKKNKSSFSVSSSSFFDHADNNILSSNVTYDKFQTIQSISNLNDNGSYDNNLFLLNSSFEQELRNSKNISQDKILRLNYSATMNQFSEKKDVISEFNSFTLPSQSRVINRNFNTGKKDIENRITANLANIGRLKLPGGKIFRFGLGTEVLTTYNRINNSIYDKSTISGQYEVNPFLTNKAHYQNLSISPAINLSNTISKSLSNRYEKGLTTSLDIKGQFFSQKVISSHYFQNSRLTYYRFIPELLLKYVNYHFGQFKDMYLARFRQYSNFPNSGQLLLLADSSDIFQVRAGNPKLKPSGVQELSVEISHNTLKSTNQSSYSASLQIGKTSNYIGDSSIIFKNGQTNFYYVNLPGHRFLNLNLKSDKSYKVNEQTIQLMISARAYLARVPGYLNNIFYYSNVFQHFGDAKIYYNPFSFLGLTVGHDWTSYKIHQTGSSYNFKSVIHNSTIGVYSSLAPGLTLNSNISFYCTRFTGGKDNYNIWNASASYRMLKNKNAEIKFSVFDLLKENSNISYNNTTTSISTIYNNVLQQYFMLTFSFYPRKFGR